MSVPFCRKIVAVRPAASLLRNLPYAELLFISLFVVFSLHIFESPLLNACLLCGIMAYNTEKYDGGVKWSKSVSE